MKQRLISVFLALVLVLSVLSGLTVSANYDGINYDRIVRDMVNYFKGKEGDYGTVSPYDSNACSIGILQWHGVRALGLLKRVVALNPSDAKNILGSTLYNEIVNSAESAWKNRALSSDEAKRVSRVLDTSYGHQAQDQLAYDDICGYVNHGYKLGIRTDPALEYFCDIENHYGSGGCVSVVNKVLNGYGISTITSLDQFHNGVAKYVNAYMTRRNATYNYIKNTLGYDTTGRLTMLPDDGIPYFPPEPDPADICIGCPGEQFVDMPGKTNWAHESIEYVLVTGLFSGTSATTFAPDLAMSRAMVVQVLSKLDLYTPATEGEDAPSGTFSDVAPGKWYEKAVLWAAGRDIVNGVGDGLFDPDADVTREQIAAILYRYAKYKGYDVSASKDLSEFSDAGDVSGYAVEALQWAVAAGLISGEANKGEKLLNPLGNATRAQVASVIMRFDMKFVHAG